MINAVTYKILADNIDYSISYLSLAKTYSDEAKSYSVSLQTTFNLEAIELVESIDDLSIYLGSLETNLTQQSNLTRLMQQSITDTGDTVDDYLGYNNIVVRSKFAALSEDIGYPISAQYISD